MSKHGNRLAAIVLLFSGVANAAGSDLASCLADSTNGKERKQLAEWIFVAMAAHPELRTMSSVTDKTRDDVNITTAAILTRLLTESCVNEARAAAKTGGTETLRAAFGTLGQLAMQELMADPDVKRSLSGFEQHLDRKKIDAATSPN